MQLLDLREERLPASGRAEVALSPAEGWRISHTLPLQHRHRAAFLLQSLWDQVILCAAVGPGRLQRKCALSRPGNGDPHGDKAIRRPELGSSYKEKIMVRLIIAAFVVVGFAGTASAQSQRKDCNELKTEIEAKIRRMASTSSRSTSSISTRRPKASRSVPATAAPRRSSTSAAEVPVRRGSPN